ncbi:hypothetical protein DFP72DRAFT_1163836 [Ephemerocybe angulata]|uniref:Uncharacterized protein n=1 Tax=Ephemerocybe angulata TaxID=980116 RepID=A0A8H6IE57_9AGAR|nr:hypothetical protein DFP72DRAFT_1163836 [Tulosesus angulatus]
MQGILQDDFTDGEWRSLRERMTRERKRMSLPSLPSFEQDPVVWADFLKRVCATPKRKRYENAWPVKAMWDVRYRRQSPKHPKVTLQNKAKILEALPAESASCATEVSCKEDEEAPRQERTRQWAPRAVLQTTRRARTEIWSPISSSHQPLVLHRSRLNVPLKHRDSLNHVIHVGCFDCGRALPRSLAGPNATIRSLAGAQNTHLLDVLFDAGIVSDTHLALFLERWAPEHRRYFIEKLVATPIMKHILAQKLGADGDPSFTTMQTYSDTNSSWTFTHSPPSHLPPSSDLEPTIAYTCPVHSGVDISIMAPAVRRFFHSRGPWSSELLPVFARVGIKTEADLAEFCEFSIEEKENTFLGVKLNTFQEVVLKNILLG